MIYIGTSGWAYEHWKERFYPPSFKNDKLVFYSKSFQTVEINSSFYRIPDRKIFRKWHDSVRDEFVFSAKLYRGITQYKKLRLDAKTGKLIENYLENIRELKNKLKTILIQLPPGFGLDLERLETFLNFFRKEMLKKIGVGPRIAVEFRNESWFNLDVYRLLKDKGCALVIASSPSFPTKMEFTSDFAYIRFHGSTSLFSSRYSEEELNKWALKIKKFPSKIKEIYIYFNNDANAYAVENAEYLKKILKQE